jgi:hypothetical protein
MSDNANEGLGAELRPWVREQLDAAVQTLNTLQVFDDPFVESKPAWVLPMQILLGKARAQSDPFAFKWFICGELPFDHIESAAAATPREALRHFAMKWQMDAGQIDANAAANLIDKAELLYDLSEDDRFWSA